MASKKEKAASAKPAPETAAEEATPAAPDKTPSTTVPTIEDAVTYAKAAGVDLADDIKITAAVWAKSARMRLEHQGGFLQWAAQQKINKATTKEWQAHFDKYRTARVR